MCSSDLCQVRFRSLAPPKLSLIRVLTSTTGHYAGHADPDPALFWEGPAPSGIRKGLLTKFPRWNTEETWLRGAWPTNKNGVAQYTSIFPGYYTGRATRTCYIVALESLELTGFADVHVKVHTEWEPLANGTFTSGRLIHTGQLFVEDSINEVIDKVRRATPSHRAPLTSCAVQLSPYDINPIKNKWGRTRNWADSLQIYQESHANGYGPTFDVQKIGGVIQQGLIGYITIGVDLSNDFDRSATQQNAGYTV
mgnify:FL=1